MNTDRVKACRDPFPAGGNVHAMAADGKPACGPWWDEAEKPAVWMDTSHRITCRVCIRVLGDLPGRDKVVLFDPLSTRTPLVHLAAGGRWPHPECSGRKDRTYDRVPDDTLVTCSHCLGTGLPRGRKPKR